MTNPKILVIEDDPGIRTLLKFQLEGAGYEVSLAGDGREGLALLERALPDLIMTDLMMPEIDGQEVCRRVRSSYRTAHIPVILLSARSDAPARVGSLGDGANDYLTKPYDRAEMLLRVRNLLTWGRAQREANPLTGLPGNVAIESEVSRRLAVGAPFLFMYVDIDNFKAFNDAYGYVRGDDAIRLLGRLLMTTVGELGRPTDFIGHVGGDDFVVISETSALQPLTAALIEHFDRESRWLYSEEHRQNDGIEVVNRQGQPERFPLMSITIAAVESDRHHITHLAQLNDLAAELKRFGKGLKGSVVVYERRGTQDRAARTGTDG